MTSSVVETHPSPIGVRRATLTFAWLSLIGQIVIVFTGGLVRLTGSGLGCSTWPQCEPGRFTPVFHEASSIHPFIEFGNRTLTFVLTAFAVGLAWCAWRERRRATSFKVICTLPLLGIAIQAVVGGLAVHSLLNPTIVGYHLLLSVILVWLSALIVVRAREGDGAPVPLVTRGVRRLAWAEAIVFVPVAVLGVITTGAGPHSGDEVQGYRFAIDPAMAARMHSGVVWIFVILLIVYIVALHRTGTPERVRRMAWLAAGATALQGAIGYIQFATGLPVPVVALHLLGLALLTAALAFAVLATRQRGALVRSVA